MIRETHFNLLLFLLAVVTVIMGQFALCYEALVCRSSSSLTELAMCKKWACPFLILIPAVFGTRAMRYWGLVTHSISITSLFVMISINGRFRPSTGHLAGVQGIVQDHYPEIVWTTLFYFPFVFAILYFPERVFGDSWRAIFRLPTANFSVRRTWAEAWITESTTEEPS